VTLEKIILYALGLIALLIFVYYANTFEKTLNYNNSYEAMVKKTIQESVKPECLK